MIPSTEKRLRSLRRISALSEISSAMISEAPLSASSTPSTPFSSFMYSGASSSGAVPDFCSYIFFASGSRPFSFATDARVFLFGLYGLYKSSSSARVAAAEIASASSGVIFSCSVMEFEISSRLLSRLRRYWSLSEISRRVWSSRVPWASFL